ncbi:MULTISPECIES: FAD-binding dehydrogenase [Rhodomicrobium]|uniref:FAD-binding dehydrogenase n=1 Tax=Rhodomicrobium TaxID=1068 RepID=UPI000B4ACE8A|nr:MULTISPECIES: FAD-binding dehydrogenase [Rhodomicrobium]
MAEDSADAIVVGAGLSGLVAATELADAGKRVLVIDQEPEQSLGGQAFWSLGGLLFVNSPEQRRMGIRDSRDLAMQDWLGSAGFDRPEDAWPRKWAEAYIDFAAGEKRQWLHGQGMRFFPLVGWAERGGYTATEHGNSVPRFHLTWGTGPGVLEPFIRRAREAERRGLISFRFRHRVNELTKSGGAVDGVSGEILEPSDVERGAPSSRLAERDFALKAQAVLITSGGIGGNHEMVRRNWPERLGRAPSFMLSGVPDYVDGRMLPIAEDAGASIINRDRMWHYTEGVKNHAPIWTRHGIRIIPGPTSLWFDAAGNRLPAPLFPGFDTLGTLKHLMETGHDYSWFILNQRIIGKEFGLSGSEQNPDLTGKSIRQVLQRGRKAAVTPVAAFQRNGEDFVTAPDLGELVKRMNALTGNALIDEEKLRYQIEARDREVANTYTKDAQLTAIRGARHYLGDRLLRVAKPHKILDPAAGPLIAVRLWILTRKSLGGLQTDLSGRVLQPNGEPLANVYAAGEASGFGGGGVHGYRALEGTFLGGCLFSGRIAGRAAAKAVG